MKYLMISCLLCLAGAVAAAGNEEFEEKILDGALVVAEKGTVPLSERFIEEK